MKTSSPAQQLRSSAIPALRVDFVSDLACPWCAIGLHTLVQAIERVSPEVPVELHLHAFELNPDMRPEGEAIADYAARKYGAGADELAQRQALIRQRGAMAGFEIGQRTFVCNTFDAHRLVQWAGLEGKALALTQALLVAYHRRVENLASREVLLREATRVGLDGQRAAAVLDSNNYAAEVHESVRRWQEAGIDSVPSVIFADRHLLQGGQSVEVFERVLRQMGAQRQTG